MPVIVLINYTLFIFLKSFPNEKGGINPQVSEA